MVTRTEARPKNEAPTAAAQCTHFWVIEPARGPTSAGVCKRCGAAKEFHNSLSDLWPAADEAPATVESDEEKTEAEPKAEKEEAEGDVIAGASRTRANGRKKKVGARQ
jgi:hypothetical protein